MTYRVLDLFSGIGGFSLGLERTGGFKTVAFCEIEEYPRRVLAKHWPEVPCYHDIRELTAERLAADGIAVDVLCGGFPCQDISTAGAGAGIDGERSGLWREYARLIGEIRPAYVIVENVAALLGRGLGRVLGDLAALGFDAEWHCIPASAVGAPHQRDRAWIVADAAWHVRPEQEAGGAERKRTRLCGTTSCQVPDATGDRRAAEGERPEARYAHGLRELRRSRAAHWIAEPDVGRLVDGLLSDMDRARLTALGNAVVPQIPELIGRAILAADRLGRMAA